MARPASATPRGQKFNEEPESLAPERSLTGSSCVSESPRSVVRISQRLGMVAVEDGMEPLGGHPFHICSTQCHADCMAQLVTRIDDRPAGDIDSLVSDGVVANRSEAVQMGLEQLVSQHRRRQIGAEIVEGYRRLPQTDEELTGLGRATQALIKEEPW